jgi:hypothetical protein
VTELPIITLISSEQFLNAFIYIDVTPSANVNKTVCSPVVLNIYDFVTSFSSSSTIIELTLLVLSNNVVEVLISVTLYLHNILDPVNGLK